MRVMEQAEIGKVAGGAGEGAPPPQPWTGVSDTGWQLLLNLLREQERRYRQHR